MTPEEFDEQSLAAQNQSQAAAETTISALRERGALPDGVEALVIEGEPGPALCKLAQEVDAAAIVVGSLVGAASREPSSDLCPITS